MKSTPNSPKLTLTLSWTFLAINVEEFASFFNEHAQGFVMAFPIERSIKREVLARIFNKSLKPKLIKQLLLCWIPIVAIEFLRIGWIIMWLWLKFGQIGSQSRVLSIVLHLRSCLLKGLNLKISNFECKALCCFHYIYLIMPNFILEVTGHMLNWFLESNFLLWNQ